ncbi:MAG: hypothetical protein V6Z78_05405 [Holosporaceae bacterium]
MICFILSSLSILGTIEGTSMPNFLPKTAFTQASSFMKGPSKQHDHNHRSVPNEKPSLATQRKHSMGFNPRTLFKMAGCAFLIQSIQAHKTMYHPCPAPLKIYEPQHPEAANFFNRCINKVCKRYACPSELPPGMIPIAEDSCAHNLCITNKRNVYGKTITEKEQRVINRLARREDRCWRRTCRKHGIFFSSALIIPNNMTATQKLNECFAPACKTLSTHKCLSDRQLLQDAHLWDDQPHTNIFDRLYRLLKSFCDTILCPGRYIPKHAAGAGESAFATVKKILENCKNNYQVMTDK